MILELLQFLCQSLASIDPRDFSHHTVEHMTKQKTRFADPSSCTESRYIHQQARAGCTYWRHTTVASGKISAQPHTFIMHTILCLKKTIAVTIARICNLLALEKVFFF